jgi:copper transport protein
LSLTDPFPVVIRWLHLVAIMTMIGSVAFKLVVLHAVLGRRSATAGNEVIERRTWWIGMFAAAILAIAMLGRLWVQSALYHGSERAFDGAALRRLITSTVWGNAWLLEAFAGAAFLIGLLVARGQPSPRRWALPAVAVLAISLVPALSGHAVTVERFAAVAILSNALHVLGAGAWLGTLLVLLLAGILRPNAASAQRALSPSELMALFSRLAVVAATITGASGVINALFHFSAASELWSTRYGITLLVKLGLVAVLAAVGFYNWRRGLPAFDAGGSPRKLLASASFELLPAALAILVTAILVALPTS